MFLVRMLAKPWISIFKLCHTIIAWDEDLKVITCIKRYYANLGKWDIKATENGLDLSTGNKWHTFKFSFITWRKSLFSLKSLFGIYTDSSYSLGMKRFSLTKWL